MHLASQGQRIDNRADIIDDGIAEEADFAALGIDFDLADMAAIGKVRDLGREARNFVEPGLEPCLLYTSPSPRD